MFLEFYICYCFIDAILFFKKESSYFTLLRVILFIVFAFHIYQDAKILEKSHFNPEPETCIPKPYYNSWLELSSRPTPDWYHTARIGIHVYWSVLSVPYEKESFWKSFLDGEWQALNEVRERYGDRFTYANLAPKFKAELFDPDEWMSLFRDSGARYVIVTAKSEDGFALFPSKHSFSWNSVDTGPKRNILRLLSQSAMETGLRFGISYSLYQWPLALENEYGHDENHSTTIWSDVKQLVNEYGISVLRFEGDWEAQQFYEASPEFAAWIYNESPVRYEAVVTDAWDSLPPCHEELLRYDKNIEIYKKEEEIPLDTISKFYRRSTRTDDVPEIKELIRHLVELLCSGYNVLIAVPPTPDGIIPLIFQERLLQLGEWLKINEEAIYGTYPWSVQSDSFNDDIKYLSSKPMFAIGDRMIYAVFTSWPQDNVLTVLDAAFLVDYNDYSLKLLGENIENNLFWVRYEQELRISLPNKATVKSKYAWVVKFEQNK